MAFDSKDTAAFKGVWVFCEQREGVIMSTSYQLLSEGRKLVNDLGVELCGVVLGKDIKEDYLKALGGYGADKVYYCNHELLDVYTTDAYTKVIYDLVEDKKPEIFLIGATNIGRDLGPRCAARLHTGLTADCTHLDVDVEKYKAFLKTTSTIDVDNTKFEENTNLKMTRPAFGGHLMATIICPRFRPQMSTVRPGVMQTQPYDEAGAAKTEIVNVDVKLDKSDIHVDVLEVKKAARKLVDLIGADVVVSVGRGISKDVEGGIKLAEELAGVLGGVVGSSRACVDAGWISADHQVGQTGKTVHPRIYVALGISGAIQHLAGMQDSECIIAVNKNESAPIFDVASYGIVGDLYKVTPMLIEAIRAKAASKRAFCATNTAEALPGGPPLSITAGEGFHSGAERKTDSHGGCAGRLRLGHSGAVFPGAVRGDRSLPPGLDGAPVASGSAPAVPCGTEAGDGAGFGPVRGQRRSACTPLPHMV